MTDQRSGVAADPVFVLCQARTGSTLLRLLLDCHPELSCPAETNLPALCNNMLPIWSLVTGYPGPVPNRPFDASQLAPAVTQGLRASMDLIMSTHLQRSGKSRWCDKSLGSARYAELLLQLYPHAQFVCLYRFPMDVIASALEACPYGLSGYGYDPYIASSPGNSVLAAARCWLDMTAEIMTAEEDFGNHCLRIRYEDLVTDTETTMKGIFSFLGLPPAPEIVSQCFSSQPERLGMADYKVWHTNSVSSDSVGRGWNIPPGLISEPVLEGINELSGRLGYIPVDPVNWGLGTSPQDVRSSGAGGQAAVGGPAGDSGSVRDVARLLSGRAGQALGHLDTATPVWLALASDTIAMSIVPEPHEPGNCLHVVVSVSERSIEIRESATVAPAQTPGAYALAGPAAVWHGILAGQVNLGVAMRLNQIRFSGDPADWRIGELVVAMISDLLGLASWHPSRSELGRVAVPAGLP